jgi:hypothetical protein
MDILYEMHLKRQARKASGQLGQVDSHEPNHP